MVQRALSRCPGVSSLAPPPPGLQLGHPHQRSLPGTCTTSQALITPHQLPRGQTVPGTAWGMESLLHLPRLLY